MQRAAQLEVLGPKVCPSGGEGGLSVRPDTSPAVGRVRSASRCVTRLILALVCFLSAAATHAAIQFDVFLGYDSVIPEAAWFPVVYEIKNDGPAFVATIELAPGSLNQGQSRRLTVELPTGTLKRVVMPVFSSARGFQSWDARLLDERGKVRAEQADIRPRRQVAYVSPVLGALPRTAGGAPVIRPILVQNQELHPVSARLLPSIFPDNPLVLEGMRHLYLNSEKATELGVTQVDALVAWLQAGGHLIVAVEQPSDISSSPWLKPLFPVEVKELKSLERHPELHDWLRSSDWGTLVGWEAPGKQRPSTATSVSVDRPFSDLGEDADFEKAPMQVAVGRVRGGQVTISSGDTPLVVTAPYGKGRVTALLFSPEREPMRSWKHLPVFWARLAEVPGNWYVYSDFNLQGGWSSDSIFGAMLDSRQVHKLPIGWLLLLLLVYLVVIGPLDHYWLKRIGRPMLTWITFPCYVVVFSLVIYFIGYKLRAGESEWNELHVVDVIPGSGTAELRGRTFASVYSPANQRYQLEAQQKYATVRGEFLGMWGGGQNNDRISVLQTGDNFKAEVFVPVWTSQLLVNDWWQSMTPPVEVTLVGEGADWTVRIENHTDRSLRNTHLAVGNRIVPTGEIKPRQVTTIKVQPQQGITVRDFVWQHGQNFQNAVQSRQQAFGQAERGRIDDLPNAAITASFLSQMRPQTQQYNNYGFNFISPPGLDLSASLTPGQAIFMAWDADYAAARPVRQFTTKRVQKNTFWRVVATVK